MKLEPRERKRKQLSPPPPFTARLSRVAEQFKKKCLPATVDTKDELLFSPCSDSGKPNVPKMVVVADIHTVGHSRKHRLDSPPLEACDISTKSDGEISDRSSHLPKSRRKNSKVAKDTQAILLSQRRAPTVKRRRGRPKGSKSTSTDKVQPPCAARLQKVIAIRKEEAVSHSTRLTPQKERRGRPKGSKNKPKAMIIAPVLTNTMKNLGLHENKVINKLTSTVPPESAPTLKKVGKGRPKGSKNKPKPPSDLSSDAETPTMRRSAAGARTLTKPGRGRPKGSKNTVKATRNIPRSQANGAAPARRSTNKRHQSACVGSQETLFADSGYTIQKRPRGRPPKHAVAPQLSTGMGVSGDQTTTRMSHLPAQLAHPRLATKVKQFLQTGLCDHKNGLTLEQVRMCRQEVYKMFHQTLDIIRRLDLQEELETRGFATFKLRHRGRYDMEIKDFDQPGFRFLREGAPWLPLVRAILGADCVLCNTGVMLSMPGSATQPWHSDGDHLGTRTHLPPHCLNVFVPLTGITTANGGTEMVPGTHLLGSYDAPNASTTILARAGECILFDFRLRHRGLGNKSRTPRPLLYITYCVPTFKDTMNFNKRRYAALPSVDALSGTVSREQRLMQRRQAAKEPADDSSPQPDPKKLRAVHRALSTNMNQEAWTVSTDTVVDPNLEDDVPVRAEAPSVQLHRDKTVGRLRAARIRHRELARSGIRMPSGITIYVGAPVLALDVKFNTWYPAMITDVDSAAQTVRIHFNKWHKRNDFTCPFSSSRLRECSVDKLTVGDRTIKT
eukprot:m.16014 g.16014  ORF g.16014 m.16014 type:complete len:785 (-) comp10880_c0_seq1:1812-4166(-)